LYQQTHKQSKQEKKETATLPKRKIKTKKSKAKEKLQKTP